MTRKVFQNLYFFILNVFQENLYFVTNLKLFLVEKTHLSLLLFFKFFCMCVCVCVGPSVRFDSHVSVLCFLSICAAATLIICFDIRFKNMFSKITASLFYLSITVFKILLKYFFCSVSCQYFVI